MLSKCRDVSAIAVPDARSPQLDREIAKKVRNFTGSRWGPLLDCRVWNFRPLWNRYVTMPNNRNARKAMKQNAKCRLRNRSMRSMLRTLMKKARLLAKGDDPAAADAALTLAVKRLDQAASKKLFHKNKSARLKSRLVAAVRKAKAPAAAAAAQATPQAAPTTVN